MTRQLRVCDRREAAVELERAAQALRDLGWWTTDADIQRVRDAKAVYDRETRGDRR